MYRNNQRFPDWCELRSFDILDLLEGQEMPQQRREGKERLIGTLGTTKLILPHGSLVLKEGQFYDLPADRWRLRACSPAAQVVRLSGRWGADLGGCGIFRVVREDNPVNRGDRLGWLEVARGSTVLLEDLEALDIEVQRQLVGTIEAGRFWREGGETPIPLDVRLMATSESELAAVGDARFDARFAEWIGRFAIVVPPLRERTDDLPMLINEALNQIQRHAEEPRKSLDPSAYRALATYHWPGNLRELTAVLERAVLASPGEVITPEHLPPLDEPEAPPRLSAFESEKAWVLDGLRRNRFRRGAAAAYLGISRKTLYNKMRRHGLLPAAHRMLQDPR